MKKNKWIVLCSLILLVSLACSVSAPSTPVPVSEKQTFSVMQAAPGDRSETQINIGMGAGNLTLSGGSEQLVEGKVVYNLASLAPSIKTGEHSWSINQSGDLKGMPGSDFVNEWNLRLGKTPIDLSINAGAYTGKMDFGGVALTQLVVRDGASKNTITFSLPNPAKMARLEYYTGASNVEMSGLANANFDEMRFEGGAGSFSLDFSGQLKRDGHVQVVGGVNNITVTIPKGTPATINLTGALSNVNTEGTWTVHGKTYQTDGSGPHLVIDIENGVGNLSLIQK